MCDFFHYIRRDKILECTVVHHMKQFSLLIFPSVITKLLRIIFKKPLKKKIEEKRKRRTKREDRKGIDIIAIFMDLQEFLSNRRQSCCS